MWVLVKYFPRIERAGKVEWQLSQRQVKMEDQLTYHHVQGWFWPASTPRRKCTWWIANLRSWHRIWTAVANGVGQGLKKEHQSTMRWYRADLRIRAQGVGDTTKITSSDNSKISRLTFRTSSLIVAATDVVLCSTGKFLSGAHIYRNTLFMVVQYIKTESEPIKQQAHLIICLLHVCPISFVITVTDQIKSNQILNRRPDWNYLALSALRNELVYLSRNLLNEQEELLIRQPLSFPSI